MYCVAVAVAVVFVDAVVGVAAVVINNQTCSPCTVQMLTAAQSVFVKSRLQQRSTRSRTLVDQLLLVLSDGRGVFADGVTVCQAGWAT